MVHVVAEDAAMKSLGNMEAMIHLVVKAATVGPNGIGVLTSSGQGSHLRVKMAKCILELLDVLLVALLLLQSGVALFSKVSLELLDLCREALHQLGGGALEGGVKRSLRGDGR
jgi:hypothetical protein